jgi:hypothetical protein
MNSQCLAGLGVGMPRQPFLSAFKDKEYGIGENQIDAFLTLRQQSLAV